MKIGDEVYVHGYVDEIRNDVVIIRNDGGYFGTVEREIFAYEEDERGYGTMNEADRKTENSSEKPNNCDTCKHNKLEWYSEVCDGCSKAHSDYEPKDEPQTERIRKCIDCRLVSECRYTNPDSVICERFWQKERSE